MSTYKPDFYCIYMEYELFGKVHKGMWHENNSLYNTGSKAQCEQKIDKLKETVGSRYMLILPVRLQGV